MKLMFYYTYGVIFAFAALVLWGSGDFLIQRTTRHLGDWETLFFIVAFGTIALLPFVYMQIASYLGIMYILAVLVIATVLSMVASMFDLEALKRGKIAAVEPILALEIPVVALFSLVLVGEVLQPIEILLVAVIIVGLVFVSLRSKHFRAIRLEKGVLLMIVAAVLWGATAFFVGWGARMTNPLLINWFIALGMTVFTLVYLSLKRDVKHMFKNAFNMPALVLVTSAIDTAAWVSYAYATIFIPITIAVALSENYIGVAAMLGLIINRERLMKRQKAGFLFALFGAVVLAIFINGA
ncbi:MAG: DMT family transporter [Candidatus Marsarchaeota archaeon]|nr:DMT family transporter [Candidatus Marsarchaeota archaeon]